MTNTSDTKLPDDTLYEGIVTFSAARHRQMVNLVYDHRADRITREDIYRMAELLRDTAITLEKSLRR
jgi:hypothetical protein